MIHSRIKEFTDKSGYKKSYIAEKLGISVKQLRNYEAGRSLIPIDKAYILADLLGIKVDDLYERKKAPLE